MMVIPALILMMIMVALGASAVRRVTLLTIVHQKLYLDGLDTNTSAAKPPAQENLQLNR